MSNNKFQKFVKRFCKIEDAPQKKYKWEPMTDEERKIWDSPEQVEIRQRIFNEGCATLVEVEP